jgi:hypothetical protein
LNVEKDPDQPSQVGHKEKLGGYHIQFSTRAKGKIPPLLVDYLAGFKTISQIRAILLQEMHAKQQGLNLGLKKGITQDFLPIPPPLAEKKYRCHSKSGR